MASQYNTPERVKKSTYASWWKIPAWQQMYCSNAGNNMGVVIGGNGTGKSWLLGAVAEDLGVDPRNEPTRFNTDYLWEHLAFDTKGAALIMKELIKLPRHKTIGYQIIIDEGQLSLYSKEAFSEEVKDLSRMLMTVRSRRWGVYINLPSFLHLNKDVRMITNWLVWMKGKPTDFSFGTFYNVNTNMYTGEPYLAKPVFNESTVVSENLKMTVSSAYNILPFPKPSKKFIGPYEKMKSAHQEEIFTRFANNIKEKQIQENITPQNLLDKENEDYAKIILEDKEKFWNNNRNAFSVVEIVRRIGVNKDRANKVIAKAFELERAKWRPESLNI